MVPPPKFARSQPKGEREGASQLKLPSGGYRTTPPPLAENIARTIRPEHCHAILESGYGKITYLPKKLTPQELSCVIGGCRDLRLFHVELRKIYLTPDKIILRELFCAIGSCELSEYVTITLKIISQECFSCKYFLKGRAPWRVMRAKIIPPNPTM